MGLGINFDRWLETNHEEDRWIAYCEEVDKYVLKHIEDYDSEECDEIISKQYEKGTPPEITAKIIMEL